jgi:glycosyltransferase involved in cell wall biosynthesis
MGRGALIVGSFGYPTNKLDGQTVKTRNVLELFRVNYQGPVAYVDLNEPRALWRTILVLFKEVRHHRHIIYLPAQRSLKLLFPPLFILTTLFRKPLHYVGIGGWLPSFCERHKLHRWLLKRIAGIYVELPSMKTELEAKWNFHNVHFAPNFRITVSSSASVEPREECRKFVYLGRVDVLKGFEKIMKVFQNLGEEASCTLYGPINPKDKELLESYLATTPNVTYGGIVEPDQVQNVLRQYHCMLFPTHYPAEGFPGTILDAYAAGMPIIASNWRYNGEIVKHDFSGLLFETHDLEDFERQIRRLIESPIVYKKLIYGVNLTNQSYTPQSVWQTIIKQF